MKKIALLLGFFALGATGCKKQLDRQPLPFMWQKATGYENLKAVGGTTILLGVYEFQTDDHDRPSVQFDVDIQTTVPLTNFEDAYYKITKRGDTSATVYRSEMLDAQTSMQFDWADDVLSKNTRYTVVFYAYAAEAAIGEITTSIGGQYAWRIGGSDWDGRDIPATQGQTVFVTPVAIVWNELDGTIRDGVEMKLYKVSITNLTKKTISFVQFAMEVTIADVGSDESLAIKDQKWYVNDNDSTARVAFVTNVGVPLATISEGATLVFIPYVAGSRDQKIAKNQTMSFTYVGTPVGFVHDGNGMSFHLKLDGAVASFRYINTINTGNRLRLYTSAFGGTPTDAYTIVGFVRQSYSAIPGASSNTFGSLGGYPSIGTQNFHQ